MITFKRWRKYYFDLTLLTRLSDALSVKDVKILFPYFKEKYYALLISFILFAGSLGLALTLPKMMASLIDKGPKSISDFQFYFTVFAGSFLLKVILDGAYKLVFAQMGLSIVYKMRTDIYRVLLNRPMSYFDQHSSGQVIGRAVNDVTNLATFFNANFFSLISDLFLIIGAALFVFSISFTMGLLVSFIIFILAIYMLTMNERSAEIYRRNRGFIAGINVVISDYMNTFPVVIAESYQEDWQKRFKRWVWLYGRAMRVAILWWATFTSTHAFFLGLTSASLAYFSYHAYQDGELTMGQWLSLLNYLAMAFYPFFDVSEKLNVLQTALGSVGKLKDFLTEARELNQHVVEKNSLLRQFQLGDIQFKSIDFSYNSEKMVFKNLNLTIRQGETVAIVGRTGIGKSTLANLFCRLYHPDSGEIRWGDAAIDKISSEIFFKKLGIVSQDLFLFAGTLKENLSLYDQSISDEKIEKLLNELGLWDKIKNLKNGINTEIDKDFSSFSSGEKQLIALIRMILKAPEVIIFDEATANLDYYSEQLVQAALQKYFKGKTIILIAHRESTLKMADKVVWIKDEGISEMSYQDFLNESDYEKALE